MKLILLTLAISFFSPIVSSSTKINSHYYYIHDAAEHFNLDSELLFAICQVESKCSPRLVNRNDGTKAQKALGIRSKSSGMFQIKLATARSLGFSGPDKDLLLPHVNTFYAAKLIRRLFDKYDDIFKVISSYNAGHPITGNKAYVNRVMRYYRRAKHDTYAEFCYDKGCVLSERTTGL
jgi:soluble lytic murein transglycosylase-like protein